MLGLSLSLSAAAGFGPRALSYVVGALITEGVEVIPTSATAITAGNGDGHWQILGGYITPTEAGDTADLDAGPYRLTLDDGSVAEIDINDANLAPHTVLTTANTTGVDATLSTATPILGVPALNVSRDTSGTPNEGHARLTGGAIPVSLGTRYCLSCYVRPNGDGARVQWTAGVSVYLTSAGVVGHSTYGSFAGASSAVSEMENQGDGVWRIWVALTATGEGSGEIWLQGGDGVNKPIGADADYTLVQLEEGNSPTPVI